MSDLFRIDTFEDGTQAVIRESSGVTVEVFSGDLSIVESKPITEKVFDKKIEQAVPSEDQQAT